MIEPGDRPQTLEEAVEWLLSRMDKLSKDVVTSTPEAALSHFHFGLAAGIRHAFGTSDNDALCRSCGCPHPDDASMVIVREFWRRLRQGQPEKPG